jgi:hypothetical protein
MNFNIGPLQFTTQAEKYFQWRLFSDQYEVSDNSIFLATRWQHWRRAYLLTNTIVSPHRMSFLPLTTYFPGDASPSAANTSLYPPILRRWVRSWLRATKSRLNLFIRYISCFTLSLSLSPSIFIFSMAKPGVEVMSLRGDSCARKKLLLFLCYLRWFHLPLCTPLVSLQCAPSSSYDHTRWMLRGFPFLIFFSKVRVYDDGRSLEGQGLWIVESKFVRFWTSSITCGFKESECCMLADFKEFR